MFEVINRIKLENGWTLYSGATISKNDLNTISEISGVKIEHTDNYYGKYEYIHISYNDNRILLFLSPYNDVQYYCGDTKNREYFHDESEE